MDVLVSRVSVCVYPFLSNITRDSIHQSVTGSDFALCISLRLSLTLGLRSVR